MKPSVGQIVHYVREEGKPCLAAIVTAVEPLSLLVLPSHSWPYPVHGVEHDDDEKMGGTWHWPEYVPTGDDAVLTVDPAIRDAFGPGALAGYGSTEVITEQTAPEVPDGPAPGYVSPFKTKGHDGPHEDLRMS